MFNEIKHMTSKTGLKEINVDQGSVANDVCGAFFVSEHYLTLGTQPKCPHLESRNDACLGHNSNAMLRADYV